MQDDFDVDQIPIVKLTIDDIGPGKLGTPHLFIFRQSPRTTNPTLHPVVASKKLEAKDSKKKKSSRKAREPSPPAPIIYAEEEMPEGAAMSASDDEVGPGGKKRVSVSGPAGRKTQGKGILDADYSGLLSVDLSKPLEENEVRGGNCLVSGKRSDGMTTLVGSFWLVCVYRNYRRSWHT